MRLPQGPNPAAPDTHTYQGRPIRAGGLAVPPPVQADRATEKNVQAPERGVSKTFTWDAAGPGAKSSSP